MGRIPTAAFAAALILAPGLATAQGDNELQAWAEACGDAKASSDSVIDACTKLIDSGQWQAMDQAYAKRGAAYFMAKQDGKAMRDFDQWVRLKPDDARAYLNRGNLFFAAGRYEPAIKDFDRAITLQPENGANWVARGRANFKAGYTSTAMADATQALKLNPEDPVALALRAACHVAKGDEMLGIADLQAAKKIDPDVGQKVWAY